jgi:iron-sulfur cluster repair protein YtfE (RIC family)
MNQTIHATFPHATVARADIYLRIHKALRACMADTMLWIGRVDCADPHEVAEAMAQVRSIAAFCAGHLQHEDEFVHPALEAARPGSARGIEDEHLHHNATCARLAQLADAIGEAAAADRQPLANKLYRELALFFAESLVHMDVEETDNNAILWAGYDDQQLMAIEHAIVASLTDQERATSMRWMLPALTPGELLSMFEGVRRSAPPPVFDAMLAGMRPLLAAADWNKLCTGLSRGELLAA